MRDSAEMFLSLGLNPVPVEQGTKRPLRKGHQTVFPQEELEAYDWDEIGVSTGHASGNLEVLDWDLKNAEDRDELMQAFKAAVPDELLQRLFMQTTPSGGVHMMYRCPEIESNQKLAKNLEGLATIETRGIGGYVKCWPSEGYHIYKNEFATIPTITPEEREVIIGAAKRQNVLAEHDNRRKAQGLGKQKEYQSPFPEYDDDIQIGLDLLEEHGWQQVEDNGEYIEFTRPGKSPKDGTSGGYHKEHKHFYAFSTSQSTFKIERPYDNHSIYAELVHGGDYRRAYQELRKMGYGGDDVTDDEDGGELELILADEQDENTYLDQARKGEIEFGKTTGWPELDDYIRFKENQVVCGIGYDGVGKSQIMASMMTAASVRHGWKWGIISPENHTAKTRQRLIEAVSGTGIKHYANDVEGFRRMREWSRNRFKILANRRHYSIADVIELGKKLYEYEGIRALLIDPWNFFSVEGNNYSHDTDMLSKLRVFAENYCSVYIMGHPNSAATREHTDDEGFLKAPTKYMIQGGNNFANRVDDMFTVHRLSDHPSDKVKRTVQWIQTKVKDEDTGGKRHNKDDYTTLVYEEREGFLGYWDDTGHNPMFTYKTSKETAQKRAIGRR